MTEIVKVTQAQADAIEYVLDPNGRDLTQEEVIQQHSSASQSWSMKASPLRVLTLLQIVDALRIGYEVEEEFKIGDWKKVVLSNGKWAIGQIDTLAFKDIILNYLDENLEWQRVRRPSKASCNPTPEEIKTEKERRVWAKIGREVREWRVGDAYLYNTDALYTIDCEQRIRVVEEAYDGDKLVGFFPVESFIEFGGEADA